MVVLSEFIYNDIIQPKDFINWTKSESKWKRRAVPVTFFEAIKKGDKPEPIIAVVEILMEDKEEDVQKGLGTLLREIWKKQPEIVEEFLLKWKDKCGRKIIHYATEKMNKEARELAKVSDRVAKETINQAEKISRETKETAEASIRASQKAVMMAEKTSLSTKEAVETSARAAQDDESLGRAAGALPEPSRGDARQSNGLSRRKLCSASLESPATS